MLPFENEKLIKKIQLFKSKEQNQLNFHAFDKYTVGIQRKRTEFIPFIPIRHRHHGILQHNEGTQNCLNAWGKNQTNHLQHNETMAA